MDMGSDIEEAADHGGMGPRQVYAKKGEGCPRQARADRKKRARNKANESPAGRAWLDRVYAAERKANRPFYKDRALRYPGWDPESGVEPTRFRCVVTGKVYVRGAMVEGKANPFGLRPISREGNRARIMRRRFTLQGNCRITIEYALLLGEIARSGFVGCPISGRVAKDTDHVKGAAPDLLGAVFGLFHGEVNPRMEILRNPDQIRDAKFIAALPPLLGAIPEHLIGTPANPMVDGLHINATASHYGIYPEEASALLAGGCMVPGCCDDTIPHDGRSNLCFHHQHPIGDPGPQGKARRYKVTAVLCARHNVLQGHWEFMQQVNPDTGRTYADHFYELEEQARQGNPPIDRQIAEYKKLKKEIGT